MMRNGKAVFIAGCLLIVLSLLLLLLLQVQMKQAERINAGIVDTMESVLVCRTEGTQDPTQTMEMPALELHDEDFIALLEIPSYGLQLPVCSTWDKGKVLSYPCRFCGSVYNGTLVIGGYDHPGQFDFCDSIPNDTVVKVTDMTGCTFSYVVDDIERSASAPAEVLIDDTADLTLFVRDAQLLEYIILRCVVK